MVAGPRPEVGGGPATESESSGGRTGPAGRAARARPLTWRLGLAALTVVLPLVVVMLILVGWVARSDSQSKRSLLISDAHALAETVQSHIDNYFVLATALSNSTLLKRGDVAGFALEAADILAQVPDVSLSLYSADGRLLARVPNDHGEPPAAAAAPVLVGQSADLDAPFLSPVTAAAPSEPARVSIEAPVRVGGKTIYAIEFVLGLDPFARLLEHEKYPSGWLSGIIDQNGNFVARLPRGSVAPGTPASAEFREAARLPQDFVASHATVDGRQVLSAYKTISDGWTVGVAAGADQFDVGPSALALTATLAVAALASSLLLSFVFGRRLTRRISELRREARQLVAGIPVAAGASGVTELDALSGALAEASRELRRRAEQQRSAENELRGSEEHFRLLADSVPQLVWTARPDGRIDYANARRENYGSGGVSRTDWETLIHPDDRRATAEAWLRASEAGVPYEKEHRLLVGGKGYVWHLSRAAPLLDESGAVVRWYGTTTDINEAKLREERIRSLMAEVNHRSRNLLAVAQSIARQSVLGAETAREFEQKYSRRLLALLASQELLTEHNWGGVSVAALVGAQTGHGHGEVNRRLAAEGPTVLLTPSATQTLGLAIHELFSNALRYGALSGAEGKVAVTWRIDEAGGAPRFEMEWRERDGPPVSPNPTSGFGGVLIERMVAQGLNASAALTFDAAGVVWRMRAPLANVAAPV
jgi:PAS domain S-box-containing protein